MPRKCLVFPRIVGTCIYIVASTDGVMKIGISHSPRNRHGSHRTRLRERFSHMHMGEVFSNPCAARVAEKLACQLMAEIAERRVSTEEFYGVSFGEAKRVVRMACASVRNSSLCRED